MNLDYSPEQRLLGDSVSRFVARQYRPEVRQRIFEGDRELARSHWQLFSSLGWSGILIPSEHGGSDGSIEESSAIMTEFGRGLVCSPYLPTVLLFARMIVRAGSTEQCARYLPEIASGNRHGTLAYAERDSRFDTRRVATVASVDSAGWTVRGEKTFVLNADQADHFIVTARTSGERDDAEGISLFVVDASAPGVSRTSLSLMDGHTAGTVSFDDVRVDQGDMIGVAGSAHPVIGDVIDLATIDLASEALGIMEATLWKTIDYLKTREQFGQPISSFQAIQHRLVDMYVHCEEVKSLLYRTLSAVEGEEDLKSCVHALKHRVDVSGRQVVEEAIQMHGGIGMSNEIDIGHYLKRLLVIATLFGDGDHHLDAYIQRTDSLRGWVTKH